ncbi:MAG: PIN domain-containing protein [Lachnospiraceae bacterium]|nr:PIN domain-containing protein [Lachnospiraceae bacterium]
MKVLFDTCIIIDLLQRREPFFEDAHALCLAVASSTIKGCLTAKSATDIHYIMHNYLHDAERTKKALSSLFTVFALLDTTGSDCKAALLSETNDYEDAVLISTADRYGMDAIVTRNTHDFTRSPVPVYDPEALRLRLKLEGAQS